MDPPEQALAPLSWTAECRYSAPVLSVESDRLCIRESRTIPPAVGRSVSWPCSPPARAASSVPHLRQCGRRVAGAAADDKVIGVIDDVGVELFLMAVAVATPAGNGGSKGWPAAAKSHRPAGFPASSFVLRRSASRRPSMCSTTGAVSQRLIVVQHAPVGDASAHRHRISGPCGIEVK